MSDLTLQGDGAAPSGGLAVSPAELGLRSLPPSMQLLLDPALYERTKAVSVVMSKARGMTPAHLIGQGEACFSVITMALDWKLSWHFVARHTYQTPNGSIGFDGALVQSILEASGKFVGSPSFEYRGDWRVLTGKFRMQQGQRGGQYPVATWTDQDAVGLGVIVRWTVKGENVPRVWPGDDEPFWLVQCQPRNSPLWATDPKTQIRYLAIRRFANMAAPGILGGASFDQDELIAAADLARDITPAREPRPEDFGTDQRGQVPVSDIEAEPFEVVALDGEIFTFETPDGALGALRTVLDGARRGGAKMLDAAIENNQALLDQLAEGADLLAEYRPPAASSGGAAPAARTEAPAPASQHALAPGRDAPAAPAAAAPQTSETPASSPTPAQSDPVASAPSQPAGATVDDDDRFPGDLPPGERLGDGSSAPAEEPRPDPMPPADAGPAMPASSPPAGQGSSIAANGGQPPSGNGPTVTNAASRSERPAAPAGERESRLIPPTLQRGKPDWRTWTRALLIPKIRQQTTSDDLAFLLGDNEAHLETARGQLDRQDLAELDSVIDAAWARLRP